MPEKENKVRWEDASMFALHQLQDRMYFHTSGKEAQSSKRVCSLFQNLRYLYANASVRAKYIEGLENRLGRMESLLKMSGLLNDDDGDLGTVEKRLADKTSTQSITGTPMDSPARRSKSVSQPRSSTESPRLDKLPTPPDSTKSPDPQKQTEEEVEALSDRMCSLVTNNCGETRYIGRYFADAPHYYNLTLVRVFVRILNLLAQRHRMGQ